jgi:hypothetical protein
MSQPPASPRVPAPPEQIMQMITGYWVSQLVGAVARFGFADILTGGAKGSAEVAASARTEKSATYRVLRAGASVGLFREEAADRFSLTPLGETLRSDVPGSMREFAIAETAPGHWQPWGQFAEAVRAGGRVTPRVLGMEIFEWFASHPEEGTSFSAAMSNLGMLVAREVARVGDFAQARSVLDLGGAEGALVEAVLDAHPHVSGIVFDLPTVIERARSVVQRKKVASRIELIPGDFFSSVPTADVYLLKQILHDWSDDQCAQILRNCVRAMPASGRLLLVEMVIPDDGSPSPAALMDLNMLCMLPGRERSAGEYGALLSSAGLKVARVIQTHSPFQVLEAVRA